MFVFNPLYPKVLQALKSFPNVVAVYSTVEQVGLVIPGLVGVGPSPSLCLCLSVRPASKRAALRALLLPPLAQDVQVDRCGFAHGEKDLLNVLNVQPLLRLPLPAAQHDVVNLLGTNPGPLQNPTLGYALDDLRRRRRRGSRVRRAIC